LKNYFISASGRGELWSRATGSTAIGIKASHLKEILISIPPTEEQQAIASFLDRETAKIDTLVEKKEKLLELLQEKRSALISQAVTKGLDPDVPLKDSGVDWLGQIPAHWEVFKLGALCSVKARLGWKGLKASEYVDEGYIFLATPNIKGEKIDFENVNYITAGRYFESPEIMLEVGDVLIAKDGSTLGITNVIRQLPAPATVNSSIAVIRPKPRTFDSVYLYYFLASEFTQSVIQQMKDGMGVPHLFQADLRKFIVLTPSLEEQQLIANYLDKETAKIDRLISKVQDGVEKLKEYRTALISAAVTGKIDLRSHEV
jgi:type I restriction enzyme S subunit